MQRHHTAVVGPRRPVRPSPITRLLLVVVGVLFGLPSYATTASATPPRPVADAPLGPILAAACRDLLMPSETDAPFTPFVWRDAGRSGLTTSRLLDLTGHDSDTPVEVVDLAHFFRNVAQPQPWHDETQARNVRAFRHLMSVLQRHLTDIHVYRVGTIRIDVYIVGRAGADLAGLSTVVVET